MTRPTLTRPAFLTAIATALLTVTSATQAADWPEFMGPNRDLISKEADWRATFPATGPRVAWKANVGKGYAGISVADGLAYTVGHNGEAKVGGKETVYCFDAATGKVVWKYTYDAELIPLFHSGGPNTAPTIHDGKLYSVSKDGQIFCFDAAKGNVIWKQNMQQVMGLEKMTRWGFSTAPRIDGDKLLLHVNRAVALNPITGKVLYRSSASFKPGYSSLATFDHNGQPMMAALTGDSLVVYDRRNGNVVTTHPFPVEYNTNCITPTAITEKDGSTTLLIAASNKNGRFEKLTFDGKSLKLIYKNEVMRNFMNNAVHLDGYLYGVDGKHKKRNTRLVCMRLSDGKEMWEVPGLGCGSLIAAGDKLIVLSEDGRLVTANASPKSFNRISEARVLTGTCWTPVTLANGLVYVRNSDGDLKSLDLRGR